MLNGIQLLSEKSGLFKKCCLSLILNHLLIYSEFVKLAGLARNSKVLAYSGVSKGCCNVKDEACCENSC